MLPEMIIDTRAKDTRKKDNARGESQSSSAMSIRGVRHQRVAGCLTKVVAGKKNLAPKTKQEYVSDVSNTNPTNKIERRP